MHVVATAGHVDHGKSTMVRRLTGIEPDRWAEERRRGMTIDLGFAWTTLPSGARIAFVDVPGHERFMTNMLAGVGPVPAVVFVVAADEGWRTQSSEHLAVLDLLGVRHGLLVVTRSDLADPAAALSHASARLAATSLGAVEAVAVDSVSGRGFDELRRALDRLVVRLPPAAPDADVRLWIDRVFTISGAGTVVTGTLEAGTLRVGDEMRLLPTGGRVQIRGLEAMKDRLGEVPAVARVAVNLRAIGRDRLRRGHALLTPERWLPVQVLDGRISGGFPADELAAELVLHIGSAAVPAQVRALDAQHVRLTLPRPVPLRIGDVALLRDPGQQLVVARMTVLDVAPPRLARRGDARQRAVELSHCPELPDAAAELRRRQLVRRSTLSAMGVTRLPAPVAGDWLVDPAWWQEAQQRLVTAVDAYGEANPTDPGLPMEAARQMLGLPHRDLVRALITAGLSQRGGRLYGSCDRPTLPESLRLALGEVQRALAAEPFLAPEADRLSELSLDRPSLAAAVRAGALIRVAEGVYLLPGADQQALCRLAELDQPFTVSAARITLNSTRRVIVPLLELLERRGWTERVDGTGHRVRVGPDSPLDQARRPADAALPGPRAAGQA